MFPLFCGGLSTATGHSRPRHAGAQPPKRPPSSTLPKPSPRTHIQLNFKEIKIEGARLPLSIFGKFDVKSTNQRYAIVEELAGLGATVHTCARSQEQIDKRVQEWKSKGFKVSGSVHDLTSKSEREVLIKTVLSLFDGKLNILVNNASSTTLRKTEDYTLEDLSNMMGSNVESSYHLCQLSYPLLKASENASIVLIASIAGVINKDVVIQISKNLVCEWARDKIRTNVVAPWAVNTRAKPDNDDHSEDFKRLIGRTPTRRVSQPNEISSLVSFLYLPAASYINGQVVNVDEGFTVSGF